MQRIERDLFFNSTKFKNLPFNKKSQLKGFFYFYDYLFNSQIILNTGDVCGSPFYRILVFLHKKISSPPYRRFLNFLAKLGLKVV